MYAKKPSKSQLPDKTPFTIHYPHSIDESNRKLTQDYYRVVSIDPGEVNFALRIEKRPLVGNIISEVFDKYCLTEYSTNAETGVCTIYTQLNNLLDQYLDLFLSSHFIIIERQLPVNYKMVRMSQHVITYFCIRLKDAELLPLIIEVDPKLKSKQLNAPRDDRDVKKWSISYALEILSYRQDWDAIEFIKTSPKRKQDDLADTVTQIEAVFSYLGLPLTPKPLTIKISKIKVPPLPSYPPVKKNPKLKIKISNE